MIIESIDLEYYIKCDIITHHSYTKLVVGDEEFELYFNLDYFSLFCLISKDLTSNLNQMPPVCNVIDY